MDPITAFATAQAAVAGVKAAINLYKDAKGITQLQKPNKIYLENTNLLYTLSPQNTNVGNLRETFFINQLQTKHLVEYADKGDFYVDRKFTFEIGGLTKNNKQIVKSDKKLDDNKQQADVISGKVDAIENQKTEVKQDITALVTEVNTLQDKKQAISIETPKTAKQTKENILSKTNKRKKK